MQRKEEDKEKEEGEIFCKLRRLLLLHSHDNRGTKTTAGDTMDSNYCVVFTNATRTRSVYKG